MSHLNASQMYYFNPEYFRTFQKELASSTDLLFVEKDDNPIAAALFLKGSKFYHYHLGGSLLEYRNDRPNNLLFHEASLRASYLGLEKLHLGGGRTTGEEDSLFKFKQTFSQSLSPFYIAHCIIQGTEYDTVCNDWMRKSGLTEKPRELLFYRKPL